jgi:hypothetical protein
VKQLKTKRNEGLQIDRRQGAISLESQSSRQLPIPIRSYAIIYLVCICGAKDTMAARSRGVGESESFYGSFRRSHGGQMSWQ